jgi:tyrosyl-tRNA synthetase
MGILPGTDGALRMSKSTGNTIDLLAPADDMYGKVMSLPDSAMSVYFRLVTRLTPAQIRELEGRLESGELHPRDAKMALAREIVEIYHGAAAVGPAEEAFRRVFQEGGQPADLPEFTFEASSSATDVLVGLGWASSRSEARRKVDEGAVWLGEAQVSSSEAPLGLSSGQWTVLRLGKKKQARVRARAAEREE